MAFLEQEDKTQVITINNNKYTCLFYYDANVVGDAGPTTTLYLVYDSREEWPESIKIEGSEEVLTEEELCNIQQWFLKTEGPFKDEPTEGWALDVLEAEDYYKDNFIVNYKGE